MSFKDNLSNNMVDGVITINLEGIIEIFNPVTEKIFGYKLTEVIGLNIRILVPDSDQSNHDEYVKNYLE